MDTSLKRILAFALDILIVSLVVTILTRGIGLDPYLKKYDEKYKEYTKLVENSNKESSAQDKDYIIDVYYDVYQYRVVSSAISVTVLILYFGLVQCLWDGQTIGKKVMNVKVVSNKDKKLNIFNFLLRVIILNSIIFAIINIMLVYITNGSTFYYITYYLSLLQSLVYVINILMVVLRKDNRGLHDMVAGTKVIDLKPFPVVEEKEEVKLVDVKEVKKEEKSKTTSKKKATTQKKNTTSKKEK